MLYDLLYRVGSQTGLGGSAMTEKKKRKFDVEMLTPEQAKERFSKYFERSIRPPDEVGDLGQQMIQDLCDEEDRAEAAYWESQLDDPDACSRNYVEFLEHKVQWLEKAYIAQGIAFAKFIVSRGG